MNCPKCNSPIPNQQVNIQENIAYCNPCRYPFSISENIWNMDKELFDFRHPPKGCWYKHDLDQLTLGATARSPWAFFVVPFMLVWSFFASIFIFFMAEQGESLFFGHGLIFLIGGLITWAYALMMVFGKVEIKLNRQGGRIFTGIGFIGIYRRFRWEEMNRIKERNAFFRYTGGTGRMIELEGKRRISFGQVLRNQRRYYLFKSLEQALKKTRNGQAAF